MRVVVFDDPRTHAAGAAAAVAAAISAAEGRRVSVGLAGGSTPQATYEELRSLPVEWERVDLWLTDERWVPHDHPDCNGRMTAEALATRVPAAFHRPRWSEHLEATEAAAHYEADLRGFMPEGSPDLVLLGMGTDGHTASLFPGTAALGADPHRWYVGNWVPHLDAWRLTATPTLLCAARRVMVLVTGAAKAEVVAAALEGEPGRYPVQALHGAAGEVWWLLDRAAAAALRTTPSVLA